MKTLSNIRKKADVPIILSLLIFVPVYSGLRLIFPQLCNFTSGTASFTYIMILLLAIFSFIERRLNLINEISLIDNFVTDLNSFLNKRHFDEIVIFAFNGHRYSELLSNCEIKINKLVLILRKPTHQSILYPNANTDFNSFNKSLLLVWGNLKQKGIIKQLEIYYYDFDSLMFFMVADKELAHFGLLKPMKKDYLGSNVLKSHVVTNKTKAGTKLIDNYLEEIEALKNEELLEKVS